ncbi:dipeptide ABC transporter ATP-binding protein [Cryobacterium roopkundense]|uniref:Peptide/nickel transport system ATP-binding protein n=1 Tax=Cryobacterium roopkundense TaxID=1001240 RepID=A0A7W8ZTP4_9MICO|nr:ABC transporter ATP-binding protein [Cryobacterium roopkundense]MBB5639987.1 peptide/nickel transport system ATP-binding protein [Cryobacterium roopkundense]
MPQDAEVTAGVPPVTTTAAPLLAVRDLEVSFGEDPVAVVHRVSFDLFPGERVAIVGQSGSGKSTIVGAILGLLPGDGRITNGSVSLHGSVSPGAAHATLELQAASEKRMRGIRGRRIGLVPQDPASNLNPSMKVGAQIDDALAGNVARNGLRTRAARQDRVVELMTEAGIPDAARRSRQFPHEFSGGMRQRMLIAIALASEPELLIADEPTSALDVTVQRQILNHLQALVDARGTTLLFITHDLGLAADRTDRIIVMSEGEIVEIGTPREILLNPQHEYTKRLVAAAPALGVRNAPPASVLARPAAHAGGATPILAVHNLVKEFTLRGQRGGIVRAVNDVTFSLARGTTTALVGESGSGKTTVARILLGLDTATSGEALVDGRSITSTSGSELRRLRRTVQPIYQDPYGSLDPTYSIERLIDEPLRIFRVGDRASRRQRVAELLDQVALSRGVAQRRPNELSGGQRQRVAIARALALEPEVLICDEAVSALDVLVQEQILTLLQDLQQRLGLSYLFITHDLAVVRQIAHNVVVMQQGSVVENGDVNQVFTAPDAAYTHELLGAIPGAAFAR